MKTLIAFWLFFSLFLLGFGLAGPTDGGTVLVGTIGFLGLFVASWIRIAVGPYSARRYRSR